MSADTVAEEPEDTDADPEDETEEPDALPSIDDDEKADLSAVADEIQAQTDEQHDADDDEGDSSDDEEETDTEQTGDDSTDVPAGGFGDAYVSALTMGLESAVTAQGGDPDVDKYERRAEQVNLAENFDRMMEEKGFDEMSPEQAVVVSTLLFAAPVLIEDTDLLAEALA